jgi:hypothetical protein
MPRRRSVPARSVTISAVARLHRHALARRTPHRRLRGAVPARPLDRREGLVAGLMQATSLPFLVAAMAIGRELQLIGRGRALRSSAPA